MEILNFPLIRNPILSGIILLEFNPKKHADVLFSCKSNRLFSMFQFAWN